MRKQPRPEPRRVTGTAVGRSTLTSLPSHSPVSPKSFPLAKATWTPEGWRAWNLVRDTEVG